MCKITRDLRIKTREEFEEEYGENWRITVSLSFVQDMDVFLGKYIFSMIKSHTITLVDNVNVFIVITNKYGWNISREMIVRDKRLFKKLIKYGRKRKKIL